MLKKILFPILFIVLGQSLFGQALNMTLEGSWDNSSYTFNDCWGYTDDFGNEYAIIGTRTRVIFFDITTPTAPVLLQEFTGSYPGINGANSIWRDFKTYDRYAYAVADQGSEGLMVFDMSDIHNGNISKVYQSNTQFSRAHNIFIDVPEGKLYIIGSNTQSNGLIVYDIEEDPSSPVHLASVNVSGGYVHDAYVYDNIAYCSSGYDGLYIIDMTTPSSPVFKSFDQTVAAGYNHSNWPFDNGDKMIVAEEVPTGLRLAIYDISDLNNISYSSSFRDPIIPSTTSFTTYHNPYMVGDLAVISSYEDGITIMDLSNTSTPFRAAHYDTYTSNTSYNGYQGCWGSYPYFPSGTIIGSDISTGLYVLSTSLTMTNTCSNGVKDDFEIDVDCGGFCNTCDCSAPRDIVFTDLSNGGVKLDWTAVSTATGYEVRYRQEGTTAWTTTSSTTNTVNITGLISGTNYEFQFRSDCGSRFTPYNTLISHPIIECAPDALYTGTQGGGIYKTEKFIRSQATIQGSSGVRYLTGDSIILDQPFEVDAGTTFIGDINLPCGILPKSNIAASVQQLHQVEPQNLEEAFNLVVNKSSNTVYLVCNELSSDPLTITLQDKEGRTINQINKTNESVLFKFPNTPDLEQVTINQNDETYTLVVE